MTRTRVWRPRPPARVAGPITEDRAMATGTHRRSSSVPAANGNGHTAADRGNGRPSKASVKRPSGAPGRKDREKDPLLHHKVKTFETQRRVYDEVTVASTVLLDEERAAGEIVRCVEACLRHKRPVYIEVPHDMVDREIPVNLPAELPRPQSDPDTLAAALDETIRMLAPAKKPVLLAGVELHRYGLT